MDRCKKEHCEASGMTAIASEFPVQEAAPFSLTMEVEEDIEQEIESFVRFKRRGEYKQAEEVFQESLLTHLSLFPVIAEYADFLLVQEKYSILSEFLDIQMRYMKSVLEEEEMELLRIMKSLVNLHTKGLLRPALVQAKRTWDFLARRSTSMPPDTLPGDVEIHIFEIYIKIIIFAFRTSNWVGPDEMHCPWALEQDSDHCGFVLWYLVLSDNGHLWSASQILLSLLEALPLLTAYDAMALFVTHCFGDMTSKESLENLNEADQLIACSVSFGRAQALLNLALLLYRHDLDDIQWKELYKLAHGYHQIADVLPRIVHHHDIVSVLDVRAYTQRSQFKRVQEELMTPKLSAPTLSPTSAFELFTEALLQQDLRCYYICYFQSTLDHARGLSTHPPSRLSLPNLQLHEQGNLVGFLRTCDLCCTLMVKLLGGSEPQYLRAVLCSEVDSFLALQLPHFSTFPMIGSMIRFMDHIRQVFPWERVELDFEQSAEAASSDERKPAPFDIPLYLWAMCKDMELLSHELSDPWTNEFARQSNEPKWECLPRPIIRETLSRIARLVLLQSETRAAEQEAHPRQDMNTLPPSQITEPKLDPIPTLAKGEPDSQEQAKAHKDLIPQQPEDTQSLDGKKSPVGSTPGRVTDDFPGKSQSEAVKESFVLSHDKLSDSYNKICDELRGDLTEGLHLRDDPGRRFAKRGTAVKVLQGDKLLRFFRSLDLQGMGLQNLNSPPEEDLARALVEKHLQDYLAILIFSRCDIAAAQKFTTNVLIEGLWLAGYESRTTLEALFEDQTAAAQFLAHKAIFYPEVILKGREVVIPSLDDRRLPYLEEDLISQGSRVKVFKVKIAEGYLSDLNRVDINQLPINVARKDYSMSGDSTWLWSAEHQIIKEILSIEKKCDNVAESYGSFRIGSLTYSLFMPLAKFNLEQYMMNRYEGPPPFSERVNFIQNTLGLTKGLCYLHSELKSMTGITFICYGFDLKPENVLLFWEYDKDGEGFRWKLSDFGMAHVKYREPGKAQYTIVRNTISQRYGRPLQSSSSPLPSPSDQQADGTYLPPESMGTFPDMDTGSDVWSLGCIISVVFTFMLEGSGGVTEYAEKRATPKEADGFDRFFIRGKDISIISRPKTLHPEVKSWHRRLMAHAKAIDRGKGKAVEFILRFLESSVFQEQSNRCDAQTVKQKLLETREKYLNREDTRYQMGTTRVDRFLQRPQTMIRRIITHGEERREEEEPNAPGHLGSLLLPRVVVHPGVDEMYPDDVYTLAEEGHPSPRIVETTPWSFMRRERRMTRVDRFLQRPQTFIRRIVTHGEDRREQEEQEEQPNELDE